jgi:hypothetical protein
MSVTFKLWPSETSVCLVEITVTRDQLWQDAKDFIADLIAAGISPAGLHFEDFAPVVLRRRMENIVIEGKRLGFKHGRPDMVLNDDPSEEPCLLFAFANEADAVLFRSLVL